MGLQDDNFAAGVSGKIQDGVGSEYQKKYDNQYGFDLLVTRGNWDLSSEVIYDEYGYRKPEINLVPYTWQRSLYYRDIYNGRINGRLSGVGTISTWATRSRAIDSTSTTASITRARSAIRCMTR